MTPFQKNILENLKERSLCPHVSHLIHLPPCYNTMNIHIWIQEELSEFFIKIFSKHETKRDFVEILESASSWMLPHTYGIRISGNGTRNR